MNEEPFKVCPECGGEFQHRVALCADCGVPLAFPEEIAARDARELRLMPGLAHLRTAPILWARALAADLARADIPYAVDRRAAREEGVLRIFVPEWELGKAGALDAARRRIDPLDTDEPPARSARDERGPEPAYKVCPQCGGEYRLEIARCADCGVGLVDPGEMEETEDDFSNQEEVIRDGEHALLAPPRHEIPESDDLVCLCWGSVESLGLLSVVLDEAGIGHRLDRGPHQWHPDQACLYLRPEDCHAAERMMEGPEASADEIDAVEAEAMGCPACGASLPAGASACPDCGLALNRQLGLTVRCPRCGAAGSYQSGGCPNCGAALREPEDGTAGGHQ
jgi:predicted amidophosphoribosyltransferase